MLLISEEMRQANKLLHDRGDYGSRGHRWKACVDDIMQRGNCQSVLDYGCGKGGLKAALPQYDVREYDPAIPGKDALPEPADLVLCADVLEHVEPELIDNVLAHIASIAIKFAMLSPSTKAAKKTLPDGRNAHLIVQPASWWRRKFSEHFFLLQDRDKAGNYTFFGKRIERKHGIYGPGASC